jgi:hypothetical protein
MSIFENLQHLSSDSKLLLIIVVLLWGISEVRHARRHRADQHIILDLKNRVDGRDGAHLETERLPEVVHGAASTLGEVVPRGSEAGQYFVGAIKNAGAHPAGDIAITAVMGTSKADVLTAPRWLPANSVATALESLLPFGFLTADDVNAALTRGDLLRVKISFIDHWQSLHAFVQCFAFSSAPSIAGTLDPVWVSRQVPCP